jgi:hypothetical protein
VPSAYLKGRRFEYKVRDALRRLGFAVYRTARSSGLGRRRRANEVPVDLIAVRRGRCILIECKSDSSARRMGREGLARAASAEAPYFVVTPSTLEEFLSAVRGMIERGEL